MELLQLHNVGLWRNSTIILKNINLTVNTGDQWAVLGPNGSGKSFLMNIIATLVFPSDGQVVIAGETLGEVNVWDVRKHIGIVSDYLQTHYPQETMVAEVVASGFFSSMGLYQELSPAMEQKALTILQSLELAHYAQTPLASFRMGSKNVYSLGGHLFMIRIFLSWMNHAMVWI